MKKLLSFAIVALLATACSKSSLPANDANTGSTIVAQSAVPATIVTAFSNEFSNATEIEWRHSSAQFSVSFNHSNQRQSASYDDNGRRNSHSTICIDGPVPAAVLDAFRQLYPNDVVYEWKLRTDGTWKAHIMRGSVKYEATFSASGTFIKFEKSA